MKLLKRGSEFEQTMNLENKVLVSGVPGPPTLSKTHWKDLYDSAYNCTHRKKNIILIQDGSVREKKI